MAQLSGPAGVHQKDEKAEQNVRPIPGARVLVEHSEQRRRQGGGFVSRDMVDQLLQLADDASLDVPIEWDGILASRHSFW